jgi:NitT/TauT family transport system substrate-binding protein
VKRTLTTLAGAVALSLLAACGGGDGGSDGGATGGAEPAGGVDKVTVGVIPIVDVAPIYLGDKQGFFKDEGIELEIQPGSGGAASIPGVVSGQFQFAFGNVTSLILANNQGLDLKVLTNGVSSTGEQGGDFGAVVVPADSPIKTAAELAGVTVSVNNLKNIGDTTVRNSVRKAGGDPAAVKFLELPFPDMPAALENGQVDAAWIVEPFLSQALEQGARPVAWNFVDAAPNLSVATYFTSQAQLDKDPDLAKRFTNAMTKSMDYANDNPDAVREILLEYTKIPAEVTKKITLPAFPSEVNWESVQTVADLALQDKIIDKAVDVETMKAKL